MVGWIDRGLVEDFVDGERRREGDKRIRCFRCGRLLVNLNQIHGRVGVSRIVVVGVEKGYAEVRVKVRCDLSEGDLVYSQVRCSGKGGR